VTLSQDFLAFETVQRFSESLADRGVEEREVRLALLDEFSRAVERTPDQMVDELFDRQTRKYRKRKFYAERIREFGARLPGTPSEQLARGNVIRSFFIANGLRVPPERAPWL